MPNLEIPRRKAGRPKGSQRKTRNRIKDLSGNLTEFGKLMALLIAQGRPLTRLAQEYEISENSLSVYKCHDELFMQAIDRARSYLSKELNSAAAGALMARISEGLVPVEVLWQIFKDTREGSLESAIPALNPGLAVNVFQEFHGKALKELSQEDLEQIIDGNSTYLE